MHRWLQFAHKLTTISPQSTRYHQRGSCQNSSIDSSSIRKRIKHQTSHPIRSPESESKCKLSDQIEASKSNQMGTFQVRMSARRRPTKNQSKLTGPPALIDDTNVIRTTTASNKRPRVSRFVSGKTSSTSSINLLLLLLGPLLASPAMGQAQPQLHNRLKIQDGRVLQTRDLDEFLNTRNNHNNNQNHEQGKCPNWCYHLAGFAWILSRKLRMKMGISHSRGGQFWPQENCLQLDWTGVFDSIPNSGETLERTF